MASIPDAQVAARNPAWLAAPLAGAMFGASLLAFAAVRTDGYTHGTKAVSELGAVGAPSALAFNLLAFIVPGLLVAWFGVVLARCADNKVGPSLLAGSGLLVAMAGTFPLDIGDVAALTTIGHSIGVVGSCLLWVIALFWMGPLFSRHFGLSRWGRMTPWFALLLFVHIAWQATFQATGLFLPGYGQRIGFFGYFVWLAISGILLWSRGARSDTASKALTQ